MIGGLLRELLSPKAYIYEKSFTIPLRKGPFYRIIPDFVVDQDEEAACVPCSITWVVNFLKGRPEHKWSELWSGVYHTYRGTKPALALYIAKNWGWFGAFYEILDTNPVRLESILAKHPIIVGLPVNRLYWAGIDQNKPLDYDGTHDLKHMCVIVDTDEYGNFKVVDWSDGQKQAWRMISRDYPIEQAFVITLDKPRHPKRAGILQAIATSLRRLVVK